MRTDGHENDRQLSAGSPGAKPPRVARPPYRRIAVRGAIAAALTVVLGLQTRFFLDKELGLGSESRDKRADWLMNCAQEFLECASVDSPRLTAEWRPPHLPDRSKWDRSGDSANCARIARDVALAAIDLDPRRAEAHLLAAIAAEVGGLPDDIVLAHLEHAIRAEPNLGEACFQRVKVLVRCYLERWRNIDGGMAADRQTREDALLAGLRQRILDSVRAPIRRAITDFDRSLLAKLDGILGGDGAQPTILSLRSWVEFAQASPLQSSQVFGLVHPWTPWTQPSWNVEERILEHAQVGLWEENWWFSRWPTYGPRPTIRSLPDDLAKIATHSTCAGSLWWSRKKPEEVVLRFAAAMQSKGAARIRETEALEASGVLDEALDRAEQALALLPEEPGVHLLLARLHEDGYDLAAARGHYDDAVRLGEGRAEFLRVRAGFLLQTGHAEEALEDARRAAAIDSSPISLALVGDALSANGRAGEALAMLVGDHDVVGAARCRTLRALHRLDDALAEAERIDDLAEVARSALALGDVEKAADALPAIAGNLYLECPKCGNPPYRDPYPLCDRAARAEARGRVLLARELSSRALDAADHAIHLQPMRAEAHAVRALALLGMNFAGQARAAARRGMQIHPRCPLAWKAYGRVLETEGNLQEAEEAYAKAHALDDCDQELEAWLGSVRARMRR